MPALEVWLYGEVAGRLEEAGGRMAFAYGEGWVRDGRPPLSQSLVVRAEPHGDEASRPFFAGLLPEGEVRDVVARRLGVTSRNDFAMLAAIGGDCAGAVSLWPPGASAPSRHEGRVNWLDEQDLADLLAELPQRPLRADPEEGIRLSLAGAQDKVPVVARGGRIGLPTGDLPSTHILKAPITRFTDTVANEAFCLRLATTAGLDAATAEPMRGGEREFLLVTRYDREGGEEDVRRLHQEDVCQALSVPPDQKYQREGGPGLSDCAGVIRSATTRPAADLLRFVDALTLNLVVGNHDAHGKNFSLLYLPTAIVLAPLYDVISTAVYPGLDRKLAMKVGGEYRPDYVERRHIDRFSAECGLGPAQVRRRMSALTSRIASVAPVLASSFADEGWDKPVIAEVVELIARRTERLARVLKHG